MNWSLLSQYKSELMGVSALFILFFHLGLCDFLWIGVDFFIVLSAIGCYFSLSRCYDNKHFYRKRLSRVIPPFLTVSVPYYFIAYLGGIKWFLAVWLAMGLGVFLGSFSFWFVPFILFCYLLAPMIYQKGNVKVMIIVYILSYIIACLYPQAYIFFIRIPLFFLAMHFSYLVSNRSVVQKQVIYIPIVLLPLSLVLIEMDYEWRDVFIVFSFLSMPLLLWFSKILDTIRIFNPFLRFIGKISLETYLVQEFVAFKLASMMTNDFLWRLLLRIVLTISLAYLLFMVVRTIKSKLNLNIV